MQKWGIFRACTRGCDVALGGHVALPRGQARALAWRGSDTWMLFIFIIYIVL